MKQVGSGIRASSVQAMLESASNAADKGQSQFETPVEAGKALCQLLPRWRQTIVDLTCGSGNLLYAAEVPKVKPEKGAFIYRADGTMGDHTDNLLGCDIDDCSGMKAAGRRHITRVVADVTKFSQLLDEVQWRCDLSLWNPPFGLHFYKENLSYLANSPLENVRDAFNAHDSHAGRDKIDSTIAAICMALHFHSDRGESFLIANHATIQRLIYAPNAPHSTLQNHVWAYLTFAGNLMTNIKDCNFNHEDEFKTAVLYFARGHYSGIDQVRHFETLEHFKAVSTEEKTNWRHKRNGMSVNSDYNYCRDTKPLFEAAKDEWAVRTKTSRHPHYNIWTGEDGKIQTNLSLFESSSVKVDKELAKRLFELNDQSPLALVLQSEQRKALLWAVNSGIWRVDPKLPELVAKCVRDYHAVRAPLQPLPPIQAMGYLDEENFIVCKRDMRRGSETLFFAGQRYELSTKTEIVERRTEKPTLSFGMDTFLMNGQELIISIKDAAGKDRQFVDARHLTKDVVIGDNKPRWNYTTNKEEKPPEYLKLQDLVEHFEIPIVNDVADCDPEGYRAALETLKRIEAKINELWKFDGKEGVFKIKHFQNEDLARGSLHDGFILAWATGLGKTLATFLWPLIKCGVDWERGLYPAAPVLIVAPEGLHAQIKQEAWDIFRTSITSIKCQEDYLDLTLSNGLKPGWYITSYTQLSGNGVQHLTNPNEIESLEPDSGGIDKLATCMVELGVTYDMALAHKSSEPVLRRALTLCCAQYALNMEGVGEYKGKFKCVWSPSLSDLCGRAFKCVVLDEGVKIKGDDTIIGAGVRQMDPEYRLVLTATPIKNRLPDIFWLAWWATGGHPEPTPRFPYEPSTEAKCGFTEEFLVCERNLSKEARESENGRPKSSRVRGGKMRRGKATAEVCNIHRLWKLLAPIVLRRRKQDVGEDIVPKIRQPLRVPMGAKQAEVYKYHLEADYCDKEGNPHICAQLTALRSVAAAPHSPLLGRVGEKDGKFRSEVDYIPKAAAALTLIEKIIRRGESVAVFSALREPLDTLGRRLYDAGVPFEMMDGRKSAAARGVSSKDFALGRKLGGKPVSLNGVKAMAEGHNWFRVNNAILIAYDWAYDLFEQCINRIHRMNSPLPVNVYPIICEGSIDRKLEALIDEKGNACELVLDGQLLGENVAEVNLLELLKIAASEFTEAKTYPEEKLEAEWPALKAQLRDAWLTSEHKFGRGGSRQESRQTGTIIQPPTIVAPPQFKPSAATLARINAGKVAVAA
jgi:hypothetical protein